MEPEINATSKRKKKHKKEKHSKKTKVTESDVEELHDQSTAGGQGLDSPSKVTCTSKVTKEATENNINSEEAGGLNEGHKKRKNKNHKTKNEVDEDVSNDQGRHGEMSNSNMKMTKHSKQKKQKTNEKSAEKVDIDQIEEEEDPEKAAIRKKKREKRHLKKLEQLRLKQEREARAGTAKASAIAYLKQWDTARDKWRFMKVRQVWCLQNMFDNHQMDDDTFEILLRYLEPLKGRSRETTVAEAEKIIKENEDATDLDGDMMVKNDRAGRIIQMLSD